MSNERRAWVWGLVVEQADGDPVEVAHVGAAAISAAGVDGSAVTVTLTATPRETVYASDPLASELEELTLTLGEGPGIDAVTGGPALAGDLTSAECAARWPAFAPGRRRRRRDGGVRAAAAGRRDTPRRDGPLPRARRVRSIMTNSPTHCCSPTPPAPYCSTRCPTAATAARTGTGTGRSAPP